MSPKFSSILATIYYILTHLVSAQHVVGVVVANVMRVAKYENMEYTFGLAQGPSANILYIIYAHIIFARCDRVNLFVEAAP